MGGRLLRRRSWGLGAAACGAKSEGRRTAREGDSSLAGMITGRGGALGARGRGGVGTTGGGVSEPSVSSGWTTAAWGSLGTGATGGAQGEGIVAGAASTAAG